MKTGGSVTTNYSDVHTSGKMNVGNGPMAADMGTSFCIDEDIKQQL